jgi:VanZ family protein
MLGSRAFALYAITAGLLAVTLYYGLVFKDPFPDHPLLRGRNNLARHFMAFLALTLPVRLLFPRWTSLAALASCGAAIEVLHIFQPGRTADFYDFIASSMGILVGAVCLALLLRGIQKISKSNGELSFRMTHLSHRPLIC